MINCESIGTENKNKDRHFVVSYNISQSSTDENVNAFLIILYA